MKMIRRSAWMVLILGAVMGCGTQEEAAPPLNPTPPPNAPGPGMRPIPQRAPGEESKTAPTKEMTPAPSKEQPKAGESKKSEESKKDEPPKVEGPKAEGSKGETGAVKLSADELAAIKELPVAEQAQAIKQAVCPVSGHNLGSIDKPVKVAAEGRTFFLCCEECQEKVKKDPKAVIAKLDKK
jgi:YHS domain-containing protein